MDEVDFFPPPASPAREILALAYAHITKIFPADVAPHQQLIALFLPECAGRSLFQLTPHNPPAPLAVLPLRVIPFNDYRKICTLQMLLR
jgi:hypothetical protein